MGRADPAGGADCDGRAGRGQGGHGALDAAGPGRAVGGGAGPECAFHAALEAGGEGDAGGGVKGGIFNFPWSHLALRAEVTCLEQKANNFACAI